MKILISNDDGYRAEGIVALYHALKLVADVEVVAPEHNNSAKSNALTLHSPLYVRQGENGFRYVNGTPADCVHIALTGLLGYRPDLVVSGINNGANMGDDTLYSGTVGAAMEGYLFGSLSLRSLALAEKPCTGLAMRVRPWTMAKAPIFMPLKMVTSPSHLCRSTSQTTRMLAFGHKICPSSKSGRGDGTAPWFSHQAQHPS